MINGRKVRKMCVKFAKAVLPQSAYKALRRYALTRRALGQPDRQLQSSFSPGLVSVVLPVYNVEAYVEQCINSVLAQSFTRIEVIVVIDGATDSSEEIVRRVAADHPQVRVICQENAGLSAARNAGVAAAKGEFLWFIDSDDKVDERAAEKMVSSLTSSGSDFVVVGYYRFNSKRRWNPGLWIQKAHRVNRKATNIRDFPEILCSAVAWNKMYRRDFWSKTGLKFPVGELYEDQEVSAKAYANAKSFDVLHAQLYGRRAREDNSSISQQTLQERDVKARIMAIQESMKVLEAAGQHQASRTRLIQFLNYDFQHSGTELESVSDEYWSILRNGVESLTTGMEPFEWAQVNPHFACLEWLVSQDRRSEAESYLRQQGTNANRLKVSWRNGWLVAHLPFWDSPELSIPDYVLAVPVEECRLQHSIRRAYWDSEGSFLRIEGWAYLEGFDLTENVSAIDAALVGGGKRIALEVRRHHDEYVDVVSENAVSDYRNAGFDIIIYPDALPESPRTMDYDIELSVTTKGLSKTVKVSHVNRWSSAFRSSFATSEGGTRVGLVFPERDSVQVRVSHPQFSVDEVRVNENMIIGVIRANRWTVMQPFAIALTSDKVPGKIIASVVLVNRGPQLWEFLLPVPALEWRKYGDLLVRIVTANKTKEIIDWANPPQDLPLRVPGADLGVSRNRGGNFAVFSLANHTLRIESIEF